jgi:hypothetical protein
MSQSIQPPNYLANMPNPQQSFVQGLQLGQGVLGIQQEQQSQEQMRQALGELAANPTTENITRAMIQFPSLADKLKEPLKSVTETERTGRISSVMPIYSALASGNPDIARDRLLEMATAAENSGREGEARRFRTLADTARINPGMAMLEIGGVLAANMGPDKFFDTFKGFSTLPSTVQRERAEASRTTTQAIFEPQSQQAALAKIYGDLDNATQRLGLDAEKARTDAALKYEELRARGGNLSADGEKRLNDAVVAATVGGQQADRMSALASTIEQKIRASGIQARGQELWNQVFGSQDEVSLIRREYLRLRNSEIVRGLPPGVASDRDIQIFTQGFLDENTSPDTLAAGLRGMAKIARLEAETKAMEGEWIGSFGRLQNATRGVQIMGIDVRPGTSFRDFAKAFAESRATAMAPRQESETGASLLNRYGQ